MATTRRTALGAALVAGTASTLSGAAQAAQASQAGDKVVYHFDNTIAQATKGLRNMRNHLDTAPDTRIIAVAHAEGIDFLMEGAKDPKNPDIDYGSLVSALVARGAVFEICEITLKNRKLDKSQFVLDASFTPSGVVRVARLQQREGFAYLKP